MICVHLNIPLKTYVCILVVPVFPVPRRPVLLTVLEEARQDGTRDPAQELQVPTHPPAAKIKLGTGQVLGNAVVN